MIGDARQSKRIFTRQSIQREKQAGYDGSREFLSLLACICADRTFFPLTLIFQYGSGRILDNLVRDCLQGEKCHIATSPNGWSSNEYGLLWLKTVFDQYNRPKAIARQQRLLVVDGRSSHVNLVFLE
jgi:hypothetical protein